MYPTRKIPWGLVLQWVVIIFVGILLIKFVATNFIGVIIGAVVGAVITRRHYLQQIGEQRGQQDLGYGQDAYYGAQGYQQALTSGHQAQVGAGYGQFDQPQQQYATQQAYADPGYTCGNCGTPLRQEGAYWKCNPCNQYFQ